MGQALACPLLLAATIVFAAPPPPNFHRDIAPILFAQCASCHRPGEAGPFSLLTYEDARKRASLIAAVTAKRYMPPWLPEPGYGDFAGEHRLTGAQIETIQQWARGGAPEGPATGSPPPPVFTPGWQLGQPDLVVTAGKPFAVPADGPDVFWNFILSPEVRETRQVRAIEIRPGNVRTVHHANLLIDRSRSLRDREKVRGEGFPGMDLTIASDTFDPDSHFLFWKPGAAPSEEPAGMSWRLDPGNDLILNLHLRPSGKAETVQPSVGLYFTREPQTKYPMLIQLEHDGALDIPPGDSDFLVSDDFRLPLDADVLAVYPHAHYLGHVLEGFVTLPDGTRRWLIRIPQWDLNWQAVYRYRAPVFLPKGTVVSMRFHYDNSAANPRNPHSPPQRVKGGNQSTDEMAHLWLQLLPRGSGDQRAILQGAIMKRRLQKYPADFSANFNLGALALNHKDVPSAVAHLRAALAVEPEQPAALNTYGVALETGGSIDEAMEQFRHVLRVRPDDASARYNLAVALAGQGRYEEAALGFRELLAGHPEDRAAREHLAQALRELGDAAASAGRLAQAIECYREMVGLEPRDPDLRNNFGILLVRSGDNASAIEQFEAALKLDPTHAAARRNLEIARKRQ
ncbi:MAG TPA: tetratricopeptide repeat protein [Candidatus Acidoferrales bacterium]|nr:tetratricopeptide repeat protein [Candidatus Acidoferrales bacterium]